MEHSSCVETVDFKLIVQILIELERFLETEVNFGKADMRIRHLGLLYKLSCQEIESEAFKMLFKGYRSQERELDVIIGLINPW